MRADAETLRPGVAAADCTMGAFCDYSAGAPAGALGEEVRVAPVRASPSRAAELREVGGSRRWVPLGEPEEDWWAEVGVSGERLPGEWEYDRAFGSVVRSCA